MASSELTTSSSARGESEASGHTEPLIRRPAELVELSELVYRGIFSAGLVVTSIGTGYAVVLAGLQPASHRLISAAMCSLLLLAELAALWQRAAVYGALRRRPWLMLGPGLAVGSAAWAMGSHNEQAFYVVIMVIGVLGIAVPARVVGAASLIAASGLALPHIADGSWTIGIAVAAATVPPLFWLIVAQLARFMLHLYQALTVPRRPARGLRVHAWTARRTPTAAGKRTTPKLLGRGRSELTNEQLQVLLLTVEGLNNLEVAACLPIGVQQVRKHLRNARQRAGVATNAALVAWAMRRGLIPTGSPDSGSD